MTSISCIECSMKNPSIKNLSLGEMYHNNKTKVSILWFCGCNKLLTKTYLCMCLWLRLHASQRTIWKLNHNVSSGGSLLKFWSIGKQTDFETFSSSHCPLNIVKVLIHRETETEFETFSSSHCPFKTFILYLNLIIWLVQELSH